MSNNVKINVHTYLKPCKIKIPIITVRNPVRIPITSLAASPFHSLKRIPEANITLVVKNT